MGLKDTIRNVLKIRKERAIAPAGPMPKIGSSIVRERLRIRLKYPITHEQWEWFIRHGWRTVDMRTERREYTSVPDKILMKLLEKSGVERDTLHLRLITKANTLSKTARTEKTSHSPAPTENSVPSEVAAE